MDGAQQAEVLTSRTAGMGREWWNREEGSRKEMVRWEDAASRSITTLTVLHYGMISLNISHLNSSA